MASAQRIYSNSVSGKVVIQGDLRANGNISIGDNITNNIHIVNGARSMLRLVTESPDTFGSMRAGIQNAITQLVAVSGITEDYSREGKLDKNNRLDLARNAEQCHTALQALQDLTAQFERWSTQNYGAEEMGQILKSLEHQSRSLEAINEKIRSTTLDLEKKLKRYIALVQNGDRTSSIGGSASISSLSTNDEKLWTQLRRELRGIGIGPLQFDQNRDLILNVLKAAFPEEIAPVIESSRADLGNEALPIHAQKGAARKRKVSQLRRMMAVLTNKDLKLRDACREGSPEDILLALSQGADINQEDSEGQFPLSIAVRRGDVSIVELILDYGAYPNNMKYQGPVPLSIAIEGGDMSIVKMLLAHGAAPDRSVLSGNDPSEIAIEHNNLPALKLLLEHGANSNDNMFRGRTLLQVAIENNNIPTPSVQLLLEHGADPNIFAFSGKSLLNIAVGLNLFPTVQLLLKHGARVWAHSLPRVTHQSEKVHALILQSFLRDVVGGRPLMEYMVSECDSAIALPWILDAAIGLDHIRVASLLLDVLETDELKRERDQAWLRLNRENAYQNEMERKQVQELRQRWQRAKDEHGCYQMSELLLHHIRFAAWNKRPHMCELLIFHGANPETVALFRAFEPLPMDLHLGPKNRDYSEDILHCIEVLLNAGADPLLFDGRNRSRAWGGRDTILHHVARKVDYMSSKQSIRLFELVLRHGADPATRKAYGKPPLNLWDDREPSDDLLPTAWEHSEPFPYDLLPMPVSRRWNLSRSGFFEPKPGDPF